METLTGPYQARRGAGGAARRLAAATRLRAAGGPGRRAGASLRPPSLPPQWEVPRIPEEVISHFRLPGPELRCHHDCHAAPVPERGARYAAGRAVPGELLLAGGGAAQQARGGSQEQQGAAVAAGDHQQEREGEGAHRGLH